MTKIKFTGATAIASNHEALTVGAVGLVVRFEFNSAWDGLHKIAVFHCGGVTKDVLDSSFPANICPIPWECLQEEGETLYCGVYGTDSNGNIIIPSKMARLGTVHPGADPTGDESLDPTLPVWQQALNIAQDAMSLLEGKVNRSGDTMQGDLNMGAHTLRLGSTTGMTEDNLNIIRLVADREEDRVTLRNIDTPYEDSDAVNKKYVDDNTQPKGDYALRSELFSGSYNDLTNKPTIPTALPNPHKLTINGTSYDGTEDVQMTIQGGGESVLYVNITQSGSTITGDKTYAEILAAVTANKCVIAKFADANFYLDSVANDKITFQRLNISEDDESRKSIDKQLVCVSNSGAWTVDADFVAVDTAMSDTSEMPVQNKVVKAYIDGKQDKSTLEADVAAKGFTKNTGTYSKPTGGIPKADLAAAVQTSLDKADSALQSVPSTYRTAAAQDTIDSGKVDKVTGKGLSTNDYTDAAKAKVDAIPANPKYTDTVYDDTALKERVATIEGKESAWDAKSDFSGSYNDLTDKPTIPAEVTPLTGTTSTLTPTQVYNAVSAGIPVKVQYTDSTYGFLSFTAFNIAESLYTIVAQAIVYYNSVYILAELGGNIQAGNWFTEFTVLAEKSDIPDIPMAIPNPHAITFTGAVTVSYDGSAPMTVKIPSAVTDDHINSLIDAKLGVIESGSY